MTQLLLARTGWAWALRVLSFVALAMLPLAGVVALAERQQAQQALRDADVEGAARRRRGVVGRRAGKGGDGKGGDAGGGSDSSSSSSIGSGKECAKKGRGAAVVAVTEGEESRGPAREIAAANTRGSAGGLANPVVTLELCERIPSIEADVDVGVAVGVDEGVAVGVDEGVAVGVDEDVDIDVDMDAEGRIGTEGNPIRCSHHPHPTTPCVGCGCSDGGSSKAMVSAGK